MKERFPAKLSHFLGVIFFVFGSVILFSSNFNILQNSSISQSVTFFAWRILLVAVLSFLIALYLARKISDPIVKLKDAIQEISEEKYGSELDVKSNKEIGEFAEVFNIMFFRLKEYAQKLESKVQERTKELNLRLEDQEKKNVSLEQYREVMLSLVEDAQTAEKKVEQEKTRYELERDRSEGILRYLQSIGEGAIATNVEGKITFVNQTAARMILLEDSNQLMGKKYDQQFAFVIGKNQQKSIDPVYFALEKSNTYTLPRYCYLQVGSDMVPVIGSFSPIIKDGKTLGTVGVFQDITERDKLEKEKDDFISLAAHQLRTPLTGIRWILESLLDGDGGRLPKEAKKYIGQIHENNQRLIALVNDLLDVSKINMGKFKEDPAPINVCKMLEEVVEFLKGTAKDHGVSISLGKVCALNPTVKAGPKHLYLAFENLISNSIKYTNRGGKVKVLADFVRDKVLISIIDNGIGIPKVDQEKVFTKFFRSTNATMKETEGSGLGLNVVKSIIDESKGRIWFESEEGTGTTFFVELPIS